MLNTGIKKVSYNGFIELEMKIKGYGNVKERKKGYNRKNKENLVLKLETMKSNTLINIKKIVIGLNNVIVILVIIILSPPG